MWKDCRESALGPGVRQLIEADRLLLGALDRLTHLKREGPEITVKHTILLIH